MYAWAKAENDIADQLTSGSLQPNGETLYSYKNGAIRLFAYDGVGSNFGEYLTGLQNYITTQIDVTAYENIPVATTLTGAAAQNQSTGTLTFTLAVDTPDTIFYGDGDGNPFGTITVQDPTFTGIPRVPQPVSNSNDTQIATTAFVKAQSGSQTLNGLTNVDITDIRQDQVLAFDTTTQKFRNVNQSGVGGSGAGGTIDFVVDGGTATSVSSQVVIVLDGGTA